MLAVPDRLRPAALALTLLCLFSAGAVAKDFQIRLFRPSKVGDRDRVKGTVEVSNSTVASAGGKVVSSSKESYRLAFDVERTVQAVDAKGAPTKRALLFRRLAFVDDTYSTPVLKPRALVQVGLEAGAVVYRLKGKAVDEATARMLRDIDTIHKSGLTRDDLFGTKKRRSVGDTWAVNTEALARDLAASGLQVDPAELEGDVTFEKLVDVGGVRCMRISSQLTAKNVKKPMGPGGGAMEQASLTLKMSGSYPVDPSKPELASEAESSGRVVGRSWMGLKKTLTDFEMNYSVRKSTTTTPLQ